MTGGDATPDRTCFPIYELIARQRALLDRYRGSNNRDYLGHLKEMAYKTIEFCNEEIARNEALYPDPF
jgi:hypothetical protein